MNIKHTPGPWLALPAYHDYSRIVGPEDADGRHTIADVPFAVSVGRTIDTDDELRANARLIAEAPAMLEALRLLEGQALAFHACKNIRAWAAEENQVNKRSMLETIRAILARIDGEGR